MRINKLIIVLLRLILVSSAIYGQDFNSERIAWIKYVERMYKASPFEGVKLVEDSENTYLISVISLNPGKYQQSTLNRVALVKAQAQVNSFFNESKVFTSETVIQINGVKIDSTMVVEKIGVDTHGYVKGMELVNSFPDEEGNAVFIFASKIE